MIAPMGTGKFGILRALSDQSVDAAQTSFADLERALALLAEATLILDQQGMPKAAAYADMAQNIVARERRGA
jgi:hypothetical protein